VTAFFASSLVVCCASISAWRARRNEARVGNSWLKSAFGMCFVLS
jgi:hypothetical protein